MKNIKNTPCCICKQPAQLYKAILRVLSTKWEEVEVMACKSCIEFEGMKEVQVEEKAA